MFRSYLLIALVAFVALSCSSSTTPENPNDDKTNGNNQFQVSGGGFSGGYWRGLKDETTQIAFTSLVSGSGNFSFTGLTTNAGETFTLGILTDKAAEGTYTINAVTGNAMTLVYGTDKKTFLATSGTIKVDSFDGVGGRAKGSFSCSFVDASSGATTLTVGNGKFDLPVRIEP